MTKKPRPPSDPNKLAKSIVDRAIGNTTFKKPQSCCHCPGQTRWL